MEALMLSTPGIMREELRTLCVEMLLAGSLEVTLRMHSPLEMEES